MEEGEFCVCDKCCGAGKVLRPNRKKAIFGKRKDIFLYSVLAVVSVELIFELTKLFKLFCD